jgi:sporulation protein YlmC with PRC-barrel domain
MPEMQGDITNILGLEVYTQMGIFVGKVDDAVLDPEKGTISALALGSINKELFNQKGRGVIIPYRWVTAVGDIIIMKHPTGNAKAEQKDD